MISEAILSSSKKITKHEFNPYVDNGGSSLCIAGEDFCLVASDTRQSNGYLINCRNSEKTYVL